MDGLANGVVAYRSIGPNGRVALLPILETRLEDFR